MPNDYQTHVEIWKQVEYTQASGNGVGLHYEVRDIVLSIW